MLAEVLATKLTSFTAESSTNTNHNAAAIMEALNEGHID
jgi:hypothetical protein